MKQIFRALMTGVLCVLGGVAHAAAVIVPYSGIYNEVSQAPGGDYDAIGGLVDVGQFNLQVGNNFFTGGIKTPSDSSDAFLVGIGSSLKLIGATITWGTNANDFNPIFAIPGPILTLEESDADPTIFLLNLNGNRSSAPLSYTAPAFERGPGLYSVLIGNGVFGMNDGSPIGYQMNFIVESTDSNSVPEPGSMVLLGIGLAGLGLRMGRKS